MSHGISSASAQSDAKHALHAAIETALADEKVDVCFGLRTVFTEFDWVEVNGTRSQIDPRNIGPKRQQDETISLDVTVGSWRAGGDEEAEILASDAAFGLLSKIQDHIRRNDITLGDTVLWCVPGDSESDGATTEDDSGQGRVIVIAATFVCQHRIRTI